MTIHGTQTVSGSSSVRRHHDMQFGTAINGSDVRFRLWAPTAKSVELSLNPSDDNKSRVAMTAEKDDWFSVETKARAGDRYKFVIDGDLSVPDPASRFQPDDVHGASEIVDPDSFEWNDGSWNGKPWDSTILYELNVGTFSPEGTFKGVEQKLDWLVELGITAVELMPLADFPGRWGWGYDGVLPFAPEAGYGRPEDLKSLVQAAHDRGLMIFLDVVYNHFGPEGNYLHAYAKQFFTEKHNTPWGAAINYDDTGCANVRQFFIQNALYWLEEYHFDGLRLDAVHAIKDDSKLHVLQELAQAVSARFGAARQVHLVLENDDNTSSLLARTREHRPQFYTAQWDDDVHHAFHVLATGEKSGYYADYTSEGSIYSPIEHLGRCLTQGFTYQGQPSQLREGEVRGEPSANLPPTAFVSFIQNHDQIGNRAFGDRIAGLAGPEAVKAISAVYLLAPSIPMIFMGEEWGSKTPFYYFCDVGEELAPLVTAGRRKEFAKFPEFSTPENRERIPDPCVVETFDQSKLNWSELEAPSHAELLAHYQSLLKLRLADIVPLLKNWTASEFTTAGEGGLKATWQFGDAGKLVLLCNLADKQIDITSGGACNSGEIKDLLESGNTLYQTADLPSADKPAVEQLAPWSVRWVFVPAASGKRKG